MIIAALAATHPAVAIQLYAAGAGVINMSHEVFYALVGVAGTYFLGNGIVRAMREHHKKGTGAALSAIAGGVLIAVVIAHIVGLYNRGNEEFENFQGGGHGGQLPSNSRGW